MRIITPNEDNLIFLGKVGENEAVQVVLDVSEILSAFGDGGNFVLTNMRSEDTLGYPVIVTRDGSSVVWTVQSIDLAYAGEGKLEVTYYLGDTIAKSITYPTYVCASVTGGAEPPDPWKPIIDEILQARDDAVEAAGNAAESERNASASEQAASQSESNAHGSELAAGGSASSAETSALKSEGYAVGKQNGIPVESGSPYYHKNAAYYAAYANEKAEEVAQALAPINAHIADHDNPHQVTKAQVGLGNADNTSDLDKPISTATQAALDNKISKVAGAVADNIAVLTAAGEVADSGVSMELEETLTGELVSFKALAATPLKALNVAISPIQSLNGYDNPWPAGGGKNKWGNGDISKDATNVYKNIPLVYVLPAGTYTFSGKAITTEGSVRLSFRTSGQSATFTLLGDGARHSVVFTLTDASSTLYFYGQDNASDKTAASVSEIQIEAGSTATDFAPYSNICPISGRTETTVYRTGVNVWDEEWELGTISATTGENVSGSSNIRTKNYISVKPNTTYFYCNGSAAGANLRFYDANKQYIGSPSSAQSANGSFTTPESACYLRFACLSGYGTTYKNDISINYPSTDTSYHAHTGNAYTLSLGQTVYGGTVDVTGGNGTDKMGEVVDLSTLTWSVHTYGKQSSSIDSLIRHDYGLDDIPNIFAEQYKPISLNTFVSASRPANAITVGSDGRLLITTDETPSGQLVYEKATPSALSTTPTEITTLKGDNNIWSDGDSVALTRYTGLAEIIAEIVSELNA